MRAERLALFDLDHTLVPFDSGMRWAGFLVAAGVLDAAAQADYLAVCKAYVAGRLPIEELHRFAVLRLLPPPGRLDALYPAFEGELASAPRAVARALVAAHREAGDLCCIVTATSVPIARPFARLFGIADAQLIASRPCRARVSSAGEGGGGEGLSSERGEGRGNHSEAVRSKAGAGKADDGTYRAAGHIDWERYTGTFDGPLCHGAGKLAHMHAWLAARGCDAACLREATFYSDSISDLPLLEAVGEPVAVDPDPQLAEHARQRGWRVITGMGREV